MPIERIYRHGDVVLFRLDESGGPRSGGSTRSHLVLARGEATGHAHRLRGSLEVVEPDTGTGSWLFRVHDRAVLTHEEHDRMVLEPGLYRKVDQVEFNPFLAMVVRVQD